MTLAALDMAPAVATPEPASSRSTKSFVRPDDDAHGAFPPYNDATVPLTSYRRTITMSSSDADSVFMKSRHRVKSYGEVFTPRAMVDQMLNLVSEDLEAGEGFVDKTFLEPAAGNGNFLVAILQRKLTAIEGRLDPSVWSRESLFALASIYAIELLEDNHRDAQDALVSEFVTFHESHGTRCTPRTDLHRAAVFLVTRNIVRGNTLTGRAPGGEEIEFSWWVRQPGNASMVKREPFSLNSLRETGAFDFSVYSSYNPCPIHHVHKKANADV